MKVVAFLRSCWQLHALVSPALDGDTTLILMQCATFPEQHKATGQEHDHHHIEHTEAHRDRKGLRV